MKRKSQYIIIPILFTASVWTSCKISKPYKAPDAAVQESYRDQAAADTVNMARLPWNQVFTDTLLQKLIHQGLAANLDLKIAISRIQEAQASLRMQKMAFLPEINGTTGIRESRLSFPQGFGLVRNSTQYDLGITLNWEMDIWGKLGSAKRAALAGLLATDAAKRAVQTQLIADIARHYFELLALDQQLTVTQKTAANRAEEAGAIKELFENSLLNGVAVVQSEANFYEADLAIPDIQQRIKETEHALSVLLGVSPQKIVRSKLADQRPDYDLKPGIPVQLLALRPDVQQAEYQFRAAFENTNVARAYFYPTLNVTGAAGFSSFGISDWFTSKGFFANIAGGLAQPILNKGANVARLKTAKAKQEQALYSFQLSLLKASQEVSDALSGYEAAAQKETRRTKQLKALEQAVEFNKELLNNSSNTNYTDVLTAEQNLLNAQLKAIDDQSSKLRALVNLYRALGGGWN